jgi:hypothetical protein
MASDTGTRRTGAGLIARRRRRGRLRINGKSRVDARLRFLRAGVPALSNANTPRD